MIHLKVLSVSIKVSCYNCSLSQIGLYGTVTFSGEVFHDASVDFPKPSPVDDEVETDSPCCSRSVFSVDHSIADYDENDPHTPPLTGPYKRRRVSKAITNGVELDKFNHLLGPGLIEELQITIDELAELHNARRIGPKFRKDI